MVPPCHLKHTIPHTDLVRRLQGTYIKPQENGITHHVMEFITDLRKSFIQVAKKRDFRLLQAGHSKRASTAGKKNGKGGQASVKQATLNTASWINLVAEQSAMTACLPLDHMEGLNPIAEV